MPVRGKQILDRRRAGLSPITSVLARLGTTRYIRFGGATLRSPDPWTAWAIAVQIADGEYEVDGLTPREGDRVVDIGANIGIYALWAARAGATVTAYEPAPLTFECLAHNVRGKNVHPVQGAVVGEAPESGTVSLWLHDERSTRNTVLGREIEDGRELGEAVTVPALGLDDVLNDGCDLLKLDCEGGEFDIVLNSKTETLRRAERIVLEFHRVAGSPDQLLQRLDGAGFRASVVQGEDEGEPFGLIGAWRA